MNPCSYESHLKSACNLEQWPLEAMAYTLCCRPYNHENITIGKEAAKTELRRRLDLSSADVPLVSVVTRLTHQKGIHLIKHAAWRTLERGGQFVLLGSAPDPRVQVSLRSLKAMTHTMIRGKRAKLPCVPLMPAGLRSTLWSNAVHFEIANAGIHLWGTMPKLSMWVQSLHCLHNCILVRYDAAHPSAASYAP